MTEARAWTALCIGLAAVFVALSLIGAGRQLAYDEAVSFGYFIATPSPFDVFGRTSYLGVPMSLISTNNHPLFNFLEHLIYSATGTRAEWVYRILPTLFGGASVALTGLFFRPRFGRLGALGGMVFLAASPLFDDESRVMRGYTLLLLITLLSAYAVYRRWGWALGVLVCLGVVDHLYFFLVLPGLGILALRWRSFRAMLPYAVGGAILGALAYTVLSAALMEHSQAQGQIWRPDFPIQTIAYLFGAPWIYVVALCFPLAGLGAFAARRERTLWALLGLYAAVFIFVWAIARPAELYPRFFFFLLPGAAWLIAACVNRWPLVIAVLFAAAAISAYSLVPSWTQDQLATRAGAAVLDREPGGCVISHDELVLAAYTRSYRVITDPDQLPSCPYLVVVTWELLPPVAQAAASTFPVRETLPAGYPGLVLRRVD